MKKIRKGFTLVETILAITVIGLVITAAYDLTNNSLRIGRSSMQQFTALHLAEEGLEIIRNIRDSNWLQNKSWREGLTDGKYVTNENPSAHFELTSVSEEPEASNILLGEYEQFIRIIEIATTGNAMRVKSTVRYQDRGKEKGQTLVAEFTDWKKGPL